MLIYWAKFLESIKSAPAACRKYLKKGRRNKKEYINMVKYQIVAIAADSEL